MKFVRDFSMNGIFYKKGQIVPKSINKKEIEALLNKGVISTVTKSRKGKQ